MGVDALLLQNIAERYNPTFENKIAEFGLYVLFDMRVDSIERMLTAVFNQFVENVNILLSLD